MGHLVLARKEGLAIQLSIAPEVDLTEVLVQLRAGIYSDAAQIKDNQVKFGLEAPDSVLGLRGEFLEGHT